MADNTTLPGTGEVYRSKDRAGVKAQVVGLDLTPGDASETLMGAANPLPTKLQQSYTIIDSSTANLAAAAVYTTQWFSNANGGVNYQVTARADQSLTIAHENSWDGSTVHLSHDHYADANQTYSRTHGSFTPYHRYKFTNTGGSTTTVLYLAVTQSFFPYVQVEPCPKDEVTTTPLTGSATYTSGTYYCKGRGNGISILGKADQSGTVYIEVSHNAISWEIIDTHSYTAGDIFKEIHLIPASYFRMRWVNGGVAQGSFLLQIIQRYDPSSNTVKIDDTANVVEIGVELPSGTSVIGKVGIDQTTPGTTNRVDIGAALPTGANAIGKLAANSGVDIGDVDVLSLPAVTIASAQTLATVTTVGTVTTLTGGGVAHDGIDSGNPLKIGGRADTTFQTAAADGDRVDALFDVYGVQRVRNDQPNRWSYHENSSSALTDASVQAAPGAGLSVYITDIVFSTGAATAINIFLEEGASMILGPYYLEAVAGRGVAIQFATPHKCTANTAVTVTTSAAIAHGLDIKGFIAP